MGAILLRLEFEFLGLRTALTGVLTPLANTSTNQIPAVDVLPARWYRVTLGAEQASRI